MLDSLRAHTNGEMRKAPQMRAAAVLTGFKVLGMQKVLVITTAGFSAPRKVLLG
jgi:hypothetical protein